MTSSRTVHARASNRTTYAPRQIGGVNPFHPPSTTTGDIELEDGSGHWLWENGDAIAWGGGPVTGNQMGLENDAGAWLFGDASIIDWG